LHQHCIAGRSVAKNLINIYIFIRSKGAASKKTNNKKQQQTSINKETSTDAS